MTDLTDSPPPQLLLPLTVKEKILMGAGPSNVSLRVTRALSLPVIGPFCETTFEIMDEIKAGLQYIFQTRNELTLALSASGNGGLEAALANLIEPTDKVLILVSGFWDERAKDISVRYGANLITLEKQPGNFFEDEEVESAVSKHRPVVLFVTQGDSSTGVLQPIQGLGEICHRYGCLLIVDTVASLGGVEFFADKWKVDCVFTGTQKALGAPPGLAPISFSPRAVRKIQNRKHPVSSFYWDMKPLGQYWNCYPGLPRVYHHTVSTPLLYGLREALAMVAEEGLENMIQRHKSAANELHSGLEKLSFSFFVENPKARLPTVTTLKIPENLNITKFIQTARDEYDLEIAQGLGPTAGKAFRIGILGENANTKKVSNCLAVIRAALKKANCNFRYFITENKYMTKKSGG